MSSGLCHLVGTLFRREGPCLCVFLLLLQAGCGGAWQTTSTSQCSFTATGGTSTTQPCRQFDVVVLGGSELNRPVLNLVEGVLARVENESVKDQTLFYADCGLLALYANGATTARNALDKSLAAIQRISVGGEAEKGASSIKGHESAKMFKGEPHERALVYFHRGLLFLADEDYENAHACLLNASEQSAVGAGQASRRDWMAVDALLLLCKRAMRSDTAEDFARQCEARYGDRLSDWTALTSKALPGSTVVVVGVGMAPQKVTRKDGSGKPALSYRDVPSRIGGVQVSCGDATTAMFCTDDVYAQAVSRGGRHMDILLARKAEASEQTDKGGSVAATIGIIGGQVIPGLSLLGAAIQEAAMRESGNIDSSADIRQLSCVPGKLYLLVLGRQAVGKEIRLEATDTAATTLGSGTVIVVGLRKDRPLVVLGRMPF